MLIYDLEIQKAILKQGETAVLGIEYCSGWTDYGRMGVSCAVVYDYAADEYWMFDEFMLDELGALLNKTDLICGFNILGFDNNLLKASDIEIDPRKCYDLLLEIARADSTPDNFKGLSLNAVSKANFNLEKSGDGANAPVLYQQNRFGELFDYCQRDVRLTKKLIDRVLRCGSLVNPRTGNKIRVRRPF
jgi:hypothetical protein